MNLFELKEPPKDLPDYVQAKEFGSIEENKRNLRELVKQGTANIVVKACPFATINDLEAFIEAGGYKVFFVQLPDGSTAFADFYLKRF